MIAGSAIIAALVAATVRAPATWADPVGAAGGEVRIRWQIPTPQLTTVEERLDFEGERTPVYSEDRAGPPLFVILAGIASLPYLAETIATAYRDFVYGGIVLDACGDTLEIRNDQRLSGRVRITRCPGNLMVYESDSPDVSELIRVIAAALETAGVRR